MPLKSPEAMLADALRENPEVQGAINGRIYPLRYVGPSPVALPLIIWRRSGIIREQTFSGPVGVPRVTAEYHVYATTYEAARDLADNVRRTLDGFGGNTENVLVHQVALTDEVDDLVEQEGAETSLYLVRQTYEIWWQET